jgi:hypothetical protein
MTDQDRPAASAAGRTGSGTTGASEPSVILGGGTGQKGIYMDARQVPMSLSEPTMQAGQPAAPTTATEAAAQPSPNPE